MLGGIFLTFVISSCATAPTKQSAKPQAAQVIALKSSRDYLPVRQYDKEGVETPFVAMPNPYIGIKKIEANVVTNFIAATKAIKSQQFTQAEALLNEIVAADSTLAGPWVLLGDIAVQKNDPATAIAHYQKAISVNKLNVNAYLPLAKLLRQQGEFIKAQNTYTAALAVWKDFPEAHLNLAILYDIYLNDPLQAQQHMEAYQFLTDYKDKKVAKWLDEIQRRTGIAPNLYIGPSNTSQIGEQKADKSETWNLTV